MRFPRKIFIQQDTKEFDLLFSDDQFVINWEGQILCNFLLFRLENNIISFVNVNGMEFRLIFDYVLFSINQLLTNWVQFCLKKKKSRKDVMNLMSRFEQYLIIDYSSN
jgi:hypothetical protein